MNTQRVNGVAFLGFLVSLLAGACSAPTVASSSPPPSGHDGDPSASDAPVETPAPSQQKRPSDDPSDAGPKTCYDASPRDVSKLPYRTATFDPGACTADEIAAIQSYYDSHTDLSGLPLAVSPECRSCAFGDESAPTWAPMILENGKLVRANVGGCMEVVTGSLECGRAYFQFQACGEQVCASCTTSDAFDACIQEMDDQGASSPCGPANAAVSAACGAKGAGACADGFHPAYLLALRVQCGSGP